MVPPAPGSASMARLLKCSYIASLLFEGNTLANNLCNFSPTAVRAKMAPQHPLVERKGSISIFSFRAISLFSTGVNTTQEVPAEISRSPFSQTPVPRAAEGWSKLPVTGIVAVGKPVSLQISGVRDPHALPDSHNCGSWLSLIPRVLKSSRFHFLCT